MLNVSISNPDLERYVELQVAAGVYRDAPALVVAALGMLRQSAPEAPKMPDRANPADWNSPGLQAAFREAFGGHR